MNLLLAPFRFLRSMAHALWRWAWRKRVFASKEMAARRMAVCSFCPQAHDRIGALQCDRCACFCKLKTSLRHERCPEGRWT